VFRPFKGEVLDAVVTTVNKVRRWARGARGRGLPLLLLLLLPRRRPLGPPGRGARGGSLLAVILRRHTLLRHTPAGVGRLAPLPPPPRSFPAPPRAPPPSHQPASTRLRAGRLLRPGGPCAAVRLQPRGGLQLQGGRHRTGPAPLRRAAAASPSPPWLLALLLPCSTITAAPARPAPPAQPAAPTSQPAGRGRPHARGQPPTPPPAPAARS
jgi:hypothetical protein